MVLFCGILVCKFTTSFRVHGHLSDPHHSHTQNCAIRCTSMCAHDLMLALSGWRVPTVAEAHPRFLRRSLVEVVGAMMSVARADQLEAATRQLAAEFLVTLCEARDKVGQGLQFRG